jgi:hypothetical protein
MTLVLYRPVSEAISPMYRTVNHAVVLQIPAGEVRMAANSLAPVVLGQGLGSPF